MNKTNRINRDKIRRLKLITFLGGFSMFLATLEYLFPKPVPFMRLGLANLPILLSLGLLDIPSIFLIGIIKVLGQGLVNGTLTSYVFLFSIAGSAGSISIMIFIHRIGGKAVSLIGISIAGALVSNLIQSLLSVTFIFGSTASIIIPPFLIIGTVSGVLMGILAHVFVSKSRWYVRLRSIYAGKTGKKA